MIEQQGRVVAAQGGRVSVKLGAGTGCSACDSGKGCGAGIFGRLLKRKPVVLDFENRVGAEPGQAVMVGLSESLYLALALRFYLYPLLAAIAGAAAGHFVAQSLGAEGFWTDLAALLAALAGASAVFAATRRRQVEFPGGSAVHLLRNVECKDSNQ